MQHLLKEGQSYFFTWEIEGVVVGKNQVVENEVNLAYCKDNNIQVFRRPTGGGCVYADERNTMFSMITSKKNEAFSFKPYLLHIVDAMAELGVKLEFSGRNDLLFEGRKISGNAFLQNKYGMLMHGTFLYDCDLDTMVKAITPSDEKLISKGISSVRSRVCNLKPVLNGMTQQDLIKHFNSCLTDSVYELTEQEIKQINLMAKIYEDKNYIYRAQPLHTKILKQRLPGGMFELHVKIHQGNIVKLTIQGDFFDVNPLETFEMQFDGIKYDEKSIDDILNYHKLSDYVLEATNESFKALLLTGLID
jgi:lipoate-protein ligase A